MRRWNIRPAKVQCASVHAGYVDLLGGISELGQEPAGVAGWQLFQDVPGDGPTDAASRICVGPSQAILGADCSARAADQPEVFTPSIADAWWKTGRWQ